MTLPRSTRSRTPRRITALAGLSALVAAGLGAPGVITSAAGAPPRTPPVRVTTLVSGLAIPWDLSFTPDRTMVFDQRGGGLFVRRPNGTVRRLSANLSDLFVGSEAGLQGLVVDPAFASNRRFYTCQAYTADGTDPTDLRVIRWTMNSAFTGATRVGSPVVSGLPISSGRHSGCRLRFALDGTLHIGTGDAATGTTPQNLQSLGGKTLRVFPSGAIPTSNPFYARGGKARYVYTYGHRNVQGLARRPGTDQMWTVEHGSDRDDEVNVEVAGGNYGWNPVPGYNESVPMTDRQKYPNAVRARWSSGYPTVAPSGGTFLTGSAWGRWQGALAVGILKDTGVMVLTVDPAGKVVRTERIPALQNGYGRIRAAQLGPDHALYLTTSNGSDDKILRVAPTHTTQPYRSGLNVTPVGVAAALRPDGTLATAVRGTDRRIWVKLRRGAADSGWRRLPGAAAFSSPGIVSMGGKRLDVYAHTATGVVYHWINTGSGWGRPENIGGRTTSAPAAVTLGGGTVDVIARGTDDALWRKRFAGTWSAWTRIGGRVTSAPGASADAARGRILVVARGARGRAWTVVLSPSGTARGFRPDAATLSSARSLATPPRSGTAPWSVDTSFDGAPVLTRGAFVDTLNGRFTGAPAVAQRPGFVPYVVGRGTGGSVFLCRTYAGHCTFVDLGGRVA